MSAQPLPVGGPLSELGTRPALRAVDRDADPDALALADLAADRRADAMARPVQRGTKRDPARRKPRDLWRPIAGQAALFDPNTPTQLALFGEAVPVDVHAEGEL